MNDSLSTLAEQHLDPPQLNADELEQVEITAGGGQLIGFTANATTWLRGASFSRYPRPKGFSFDLDAMSNAYRVYQDADAVLIRPLQSGLYKVEFNTYVYARRPSLIAVWLMRHPGNYVLGFSTYALRDRASTTMVMSKHVKMNGQDSMYVVVRQVAADGEARVWIGSLDYAEAKAYSGLYISKLS